MKWVKIGFLAFLAGILFIGVIFFLLGYFRPKPRGILVTSSPISNVFINGNLVGKTPYEGTFDLGEILLKLTPESSDLSLLPYETKVNLISGIKTVIRREFADSEDATSGDIVSFEKEGGREAGIVVISVPDNAQISLDGTPRGFTPYKGSNISVGEHQVSVKSFGYIDRVLTVKTIAGYKLTIFSKLAEIAAEPKVEAAKTEKKTFVEIVDTPTGFLRVRSLPGSAGREIHQVSPGDKFLFLDEDTATGWFKIELEAPTAGLPDGRTGWISNEYSKKIEEEMVISE